MKQKLSAPWAQTPADQRREPTGAELSAGFACGPADKALFNELMYRKTGIEAELIAVIEEAELVPDENDLTQLLQAMRKLFSPVYAASIPGAGTMALTDLDRDSYYVIWFTSDGMANYTVYASTDNGVTKRTDYWNWNGTIQHANITSQLFTYAGEMDIMCIYTGTTAIPARLFTDPTMMFVAPTGRFLRDNPQGPVNAIVIDTDRDFQAAVQKILGESS